MKCINCGKEGTWKRSVHKLCINCFSSRQYSSYIKKWLETGKLETKSRPRNYVRRYLMEEQKDKCAICSIENTWNNQHLNFVIDHADGNYKNNIRSNLRMLCPNCDSQLPTFKGKNKGNGREYDRVYRRNAYRNKNIN